MTDHVLERPDWLDRVMRAVKEVGFPVVVAGSMLYVAFTAHREVGAKLDRLITVIEERIPKVSK